MKLELKHLAAYLPYGLKIVGSDFMGRELVTEFKDGYYTAIKFVIESQRKPILCPLSDLTKEIEHNGEIFVPIVKILKECCLYYSWQIDENSIDIINGDNGYMVRYLCDTLKGKPKLCILEIYKDLHITHYTATSQKPYRAVEHKKLFDFLYSWHFDTNKLIQYGLAIDINTLNNKNGKSQITN